MNIPIVSTLMRLDAIQRQSLLSILFTILVTLTGFISTMFFSHVLGTELMGVYFLFLTYYSIFNLIGDGGFGQAAVKRISEGHDQNEYMTAYAVLRFILIIFSTMILLIISPLFIDLAEYNLIPWIIGILAAAFFSHTITYGISGLNHMGIYNISVGTNELVRIFASVILVLFGFYTHGMVAGAIIGIIVSGLICVKYFTFKPAKFNLRHIKSLLSFSFWILLISSSSLIVTYADTIFIGYFMNNSDVGIYRVALQFTLVSIFITTAIYSTLAPKISHWSYNGEMDKIPRVISRSISMGLILAIPVAVGGFLLAERLMYYFYGSDFASGATACCILLIYQIVYTFLMFFGVALSNSGYVRKSFYGTLAAVILNVALDIILIPLIGINGAAVGSLIAIVVNTLIVWWQLRKVIPVYIEFKPILHILIASFVMGAFVFIYKLFIPLNNVVLTLIPVAIGGIIYFFLLFKLDKGIKNEIADIVTNFGIKWPKWL